MWCPTEMCLKGLSCGACGAKVSVQLTCRKAVGHKQDHTVAIKLVGGREHGFGSTSEPLGPSVFFSSSSPPPLTLLVCSLVNEALRLLLMCSWGLPASEALRGQFVGDGGTPFLFFAQMIFLHLTIQGRGDTVTSFQFYFTQREKEQILSWFLITEWLCTFEVGDSFLWLYQPLLEQDQSLFASHSSSFSSQDLPQSH